MFRFRLQTKFLLLILGSLAVVLGLLSYTIVQREARLLAEKTDEKQHLLAFAIVVDLKTSMMESRPRSTLALMKTIQGEFGLIRLDVLRRDGAPAFGRPGSPVTIPHLGRVFTTENEVHYSEIGDPPAQTIIIPLKNEHDCRRCHQNDAPVLGAVIISQSLEDSIREIVESKRDLTTLLSVIMLLIGGVLYLVTRTVVLRPLASLSAGADRIGKGDLAHRIALRTEDEFQSLASALNVMAGRIETSHADLEHRIAERTAELRQTMEELDSKAQQLYTYSRDLATISRLSIKIFNAELSREELLDRFMNAVTRGMRYERAMLCLVDRKQLRLEVKRDSGINELIHVTSGSLLSDDPVVSVVRNGKIAVFEEGTPPFALTGNSSPPRTVVVLPLLNRTNTRKCWQITSCIKNDCPAHQEQDMPCWLMDKTLCGNPLVASYGNKLAYCMTCKVFPVMGALIIETGQTQRSMRRQLSVLRILTAEMATALDNHRLHEENQQIVKELLELHRVTATALSDFSLNRALEVFTESSLKFAGMDACTFWLVAPDRATLDRKAGGSVSREDIRGMFPPQLAINEGLLGQALDSDGVLLDYDVGTNDRTLFARSATTYGMRSLLAVAIKRDNAPIGVFAFHKRSPLPFLESEIAALMLLANQAAMAINVCVLNEELNTQNRALARHTSLLGGILSSMSSGVILLNTTGIVMMINEVGAAMLRSRPEDLMAMSLPDLFPETAAFIRPLAGPYQDIEVRMPDHSTVPIGFSSTNYHGETGEREGFIVVCRDLSEIKALQAELLNNERFAAMGKIVAGVAHEIRNPLFGISSVGQILERELTSPAHRELVRALLSETKRMNQLVEDLLIYGKPLKLHLEWCDVIELWKDLITMHQDELDRFGIRLSADLDIGPLTAYLDANQIRQLFLNLLRNAIDATAAGGGISIRILLEDGRIVFKVADTGIGISPEHLKNIFDLFFTTKPKGTGLGLAICRKIVRDHGGDITVESEERKGTAVTVKLPYPGKTGITGAAN